MSTTLTLSQLRILMGEEMGEGVCSGTTTTAPALSVQDSARFDTDQYWNGGYFIDVTANSTARIQYWTQSNTTFGFFGGGISGGLLGDSYEVHRWMAPSEMRRAINSALAMIGRALRTMVRDETQSLIANQYQYTVNTNPALANAFFPQGVYQISFLYFTGQPTRPFLDIPFEYIDDVTIQFPEWIVDTYASDTIRFQGYGPLTQRLTADTASTVIGTFPDEFAVDVLKWAAIHQAWNILASKKTSNESQVERENAKQAYEQYIMARDNWRRGPVPTVMVKSPVTSGGWDAT